MGAVTVAQEGLEKYKAYVLPHTCRVSTAVESSQLGCIFLNMDASSQFTVSSNVIRVY